jgi:hypothetical protein
MLPNNTITIATIMAMTTIVPPIARIPAMTIATTATIIITMTTAMGKSTAVIT